MSHILQVFCSLLSGLLIAAAIPNELFLFGSPAIGAIALFPLYVAVHRTSKISSAFWLFFLHGATAHLLSSFWLGNFHGFALFTLGASDIGTGFFEAMLGLGFYYPILMRTKTHALAELSGKHAFSVPFRIVWFAGIYTIWEYCKSTGFLAYPWGTLSMTAFRWPAVTQIADITGPYGVTFLFAMISACTAEGTFVLARTYQPDGKTAAAKAFLNTCAALFTAVVLVLMYGAYNLSVERRPVKIMNTVLVQQNRDPWAKREEDNILLAQQLTKDALDEFRRIGTECDLVVWSEAVLSKRFPAAETYYTYFPTEAPLLPFVKNSRVPFIIGGPVKFDGDHRYGNSALLIDKNGMYTGAYTKMHLVPFAELIPGREYEAVRKFIRKIAGFSYGWTPGKKPVLFEIPLSGRPETESEFDIISIAGTQKNAEKDSVIISTPICFDDSANEVCRALFRCGSEVFVNITNDSWSKTKSAEIQHFVVAHYRAIEYRTTLLRAANAGFTVVVSPTGRILDSLPLFEEGALAYSVPVYKRQMTLFARFGNWLPHSLIALAFIFIACTVLRSRRNDSLGREITVRLVPHPEEWYARFESMMTDSAYSIDWSNWNM